MKRPKCMEKRILDDVPVKNLCPKCGSEMYHELGPEYSEAYVCTNWKCGHEEKVGGEKR